MPMGDRRTATMPVNGGENKWIWPEYDKGSCAALMTR